VEDVGESWQGRARKNCSMEQFFLGGRSGNPLDVLQEYLGVQAEPFLDAVGDVGLCGEGVVDVVTGLEVAGVVNKLAAAELVDLVKLGAFGFDFLGDRADELVNGTFKGLGVKDDQS